MAYVLGFIYADGAVEDCRLSSRTTYLLLSNNDKRLLEEILVAMSSNSTIRERGPGLVTIRGKEYMCKASYSVRIGNKNIYQDLIMLGLCPRKSLVINLPKIPQKYFHYFMRGYFDGDGCINIEKYEGNRMNIIFTSGSGLFLKQVSGRILRIFPKIKSSIAKGKNASYLRYNWRNAVTLAKFIYRNIKRTPHLDYKYQKYLSYLSTDSPALTTSSTRRLA